MQRTFSFEITTENVVFNTLASADLVIWISICLKALVYATTADPRHINHDRCLEHGPAASNVQANRRWPERTRHTRFIVISLTS